MRAGGTGAAAPTAEEIVGGPGMMRRETSRAPRRKYQLREAELQRQVLDFFSGAGQIAWPEVPCGFAGRADVITYDAVYELKDWVDRPTLYQALGQVMGYSAYLSRHYGRRMCPHIICNGTSLTAREVEKFEDLHGVPIIVWGNPPYARLGAKSRKEAHVS